MKFKLFLLTFIMISISQAQTKDEIKDFFWGKNDNYKIINEIPEKYKNESAVVIYKYEDYDFHKFGKNVTFRSAYRKKVKLNDQAAVTNFSEFNYSEKTNPRYGAVIKTVIGIKIIKPNGNEIIINTEKEAVTLDKEKKIAVPNLEIGDIIDFYNYSTETFSSTFEFGFDPVERTLGENYPILNYKLTFQTENDFFVNFNTYNNGPELKQIPLEKSGERKYEIIASDIPKNDFPRWFLPLVELPCYKFQVFFARSGKFEQRAEAFLPEKESIIKKTVTKEDIFNYYDSKFFPSADLRDVNDFLEGKNFNSKEEKVKEVYYFMRHQFYTRYIEAFVINEAQIMNPFYLYGNYPTFFNKEEQFINYFMQFLKKQNIEFDIIVATGRENGPISDVLIQQNIRILLKVNTENPIYFGIFDPFAIPNQFDSSLENTQAYALKVSKSKKVSDIEEIKLPSLSYKDNVSKVITTISLASDFLTANATKTSSLYGHNKEYEHNSKIFFYDYVTEDYEKYGTSPVLELVKNKKDKEKYKKEYAALIEKYKQNQVDKFKKEIEDEYDIKVDKHNLKVSKTGRFGIDDPLVITENFSITSNFIKKAGNNYILDIGKFISSQVDIEEKEYERTNNIYTQFPRSFEYSIILDIPTGYSISGVEKLNIKIENETGSFISKAEIKDSKLIITSSKNYINSYEPSKNWKKMIAFLDAAYQFSQEKVLLKKN
ncbi:DUF3857 domain-containing protein [Flavobacterium celericrescens]|uniref:DUF3857 domain-containing protein n=1 Tax=Flavobacterium celericrescens TaxID=2709780 RepID=A0ABX0IEL1_9FLAO|nr:DUF3857 domain-containing protein [Flavobacterium celericrescens]NHM04640.1 DUF3857 domain-containing protein [Flavobacterium celericrescens]